MKKELTEQPRQSPQGREAVTTPKGHARKKRERSKEKKKSALTTHPAMHATPYPPLTQQHSPVRKLPTAVKLELARSKQTAGHPLVDSCHLRQQHQVGRLDTAVSRWSHQAGRA